MNYEDIFKNFCNKQEGLLNENVEQILINMIKEFDYLKDEEEAKEDIYAFLEFVKNMDVKKILFDDSHDGIYTFRSDLYKIIELLSPIYEKHIDSFARVSSSIKSKPSDFLDEDDFV